MQAMFGRRREQKGNGDVVPPEDVYRILRAMALDAVGVVVDIAQENGHATFVALTDGTTSMYTSTGGGVIGAGERPEVASATRRLLGVVDAHLAGVPLEGTDELPPASTVRIHVLRPDGRRHVDLPADAFWGRIDHELVPLIDAVQDVITALRLSSPP